MRDRPPLDATDSNKGITTQRLLIVTGAHTIWLARAADFTAVTGILA
jgi:hypothetical protein